MVRFKLCLSNHHNKNNQKEKPLVEFLLLARGSGNNNGMRLQKNEESCNAFIHKLSQLIK